MYPGREKATAAKPFEIDSIRRDIYDHEDWYRDLVEHSHDLLCTHDLEGRLLSLNPAPARLLGYNVEELLRIPMRELLPPEFRSEFDDYLREIAQTGESSGILCVLTRTGERRLWEYHNTLRREGVSSPVVRGIAHDVTEQKRIEKLLREAGENLLQRVREHERTIAELKLLRMLVDKSRDSIEIVDPDTLRFLDVNERACFDLGYSRQELLAMGVPDIDPVVTGDMATKVAELLRQNGSAVVEGVHRRKDGSTFPVEVGLTRVPLDREYVLAIARDLTERKQAEARLREYARVVESLEEMIVVVDREFNYVIANRAFLRYRGIPNEQLRTLTVMERLASEGTSAQDLALIRQKFEECLQGKVVQYELRYRFPALGERDLFVSYFPVEGPAGVDRIACILQDVTERNRTEQELQRHVAQLQAVTEELRLAKEKLAEEKLYLEESIDTELGFGEIIGHSNALKGVMKKLAKVAPSDASVLLLGETGTGKELAARALHRMSQRQGKNFVKLNCAAIPSGLLESELFGHEKGAFTGALARKIGRLELADGGTLFLDEIGEVPLNLQPKLLRALQDMEFERLGSTHTLKVNFRLVAATNRDLAQSVRDGEFRNDLYYRLNVFPIVMPALRDRREDIKPLMEHFVRKFAQRMKKTISSIPAKTLEELVRWDWPGNVRELENFLERSVILTPGPVLQVPLDELHRDAFDGDPIAGTLLDKDRERIVQALRECHGRLGGPDGAAARLGLKRTTLQSKLDHLGIKPAAFR